MTNNNSKNGVIDILKKTSCRIARSKIHGVGVVAIRNIKKGENPFFGVRKHKWIKCKAKEIKKLDKNITAMISDFFAMNDKEEFLIPECGLNGIDISFFLNSAKAPNVKTIDDGTNFVTTKNIKKGEELTVSYADYDSRYK